MGSNSNMNGGGGKGGSTSGSISNDTVSPINRYNDSRPKYPVPTANNLLDETDLSYSTFLSSFLNDPFPLVVTVAVATDPLPIVAALPLATVAMIASVRGGIGGILLDFLSTTRSRFATLLESNSLPTLNTRQFIESDDGARFQKPVQILSI